MEQFQVGQFIDTRECFDRALKIRQRISSHLTTDTKVASCFKNIGKCLFEMNENTDSKDHFDRALKIYQQTSSDVAIDCDVTICLQNVGRCLINVYTC